MNRHVKTSPPSTIPHFFTYYPHTPSFFPQSELRIYAPALPNPIVATGFYAARQPGQLFQGADLPQPFAEQRVAANMIRHTVSPALRAAAHKPDSGKVCIARGTSISQFSIADRRVSGRIRTAGSLERHQLGQASTTPRGTTLQALQAASPHGPSTHHAIKRLCHPTPKNNRESYSCSKW